jgi:hypothetical protein
MQKVILFILAISLFIACNNKSDKNTPDVSGVEVNLAVERFDKDFFAIDTNNIVLQLKQLQGKYQDLISIFLQNILGVDSAGMETGVREFIRMSNPIQDTVNDVFKNTNDIEKDFKKAFRFVKYYFPQYNLPKKIITVIGPVDALAESRTGYTPDFLGPDFLGISLQFYLGHSFSVYKHPAFIEQVAPEYRSRRFSKEYIVADGMLLIVDDLFPDKSASRPLIEQMIERGRQWWLLDKFIPDAPDSVKTGYTQQQLDWCNENEGMIWNYILKNEDLQSIRPDVIQTYIGESPFTQGMPQEYSPGNIGQWIGWRIVQKFASNNPDLKPQDVMTVPVKRILEEAKYKPK